MTAKKNGKNKDPEARRKKIGEREETIVQKLTQIEIEDERSKVCELIRTKDELDDKRKSVNADYKAKIADVDARIRAALGAVNSGRRETTITVEEWLTEGNEIVRVRQDTGEQLGRRTARAEELQEELFADDAPQKAPEEGAEPSSDEEFGALDE